MLSDFCVLRDMPPVRLLYAYGEELYRLTDTPANDFWNSDFTTKQRGWIERSRLGG